MNPFTANIISNMLSGGLAGYQQSRDRTSALEAARWEQQMKERAAQQDTDEFAFRQSQAERQAQQWQQNYEQNAAQADREAQQWQQNYEQNAARAAFDKEKFEQGLRVNFWNKLPIGQGPEATTAALTTARGLGATPPGIADYNPFGASAPNAVPGFEMPWEKTSGGGTGWQPWEGPQAPMTQYQQASLDAGQHRGLLADAKAVWLQGLQVNTDTQYQTARNALMRITSQLPPELAYLFRLPEQRVNTEPSIALSNAMATILTAYRTAKTDDDPNAPVYAELYGSLADALTEQLGGTGQYEGAVTATTIPGSKPNAPAPVYVGGVPIGALPPNGQEPPRTGSSRLSPEPSGKALRTDQEFKETSTNRQLEAERKRQEIDAAKRKAAEERRKAAEARRVPLTEKEITDAGSVGFSDFAIKHGFNRIRGFMGDRRRSKPIYWDEETRGILTQTGITRRNEINRTELDQQKKRLAGGGRPKAIDEKALASDLAAKRAQGLRGAPVANAVRAYLKDRGYSGRELASQTRRIMNRYFWKK